MFFMDLSFETEVNTLQYKGGDVTMSLTFYGTFPSVKVPLLLEK